MRTRDIHGRATDVFGEKSRLASEKSNFSTHWLVFRLLHAQSENQWFIKRSLKSGEKSAGYEYSGIGRSLFRGHHEREMDLFNCNGIRGPLLSVFLILGLIFPFTKIELTHIPSRIMIRPGCCP